MQYFHLVRSRSKLLFFISFHFSCFDLFLYLFLPLLLSIAVNVVVGYMLLSALTLNGLLSHFWKSEQAKRKKCANESEYECHHLEKPVRIVYYWSTKRQRYRSIHRNKIYTQSTGEYNTFVVDTQICNFQWISNAFQKTIAGFLFWNTFDVSLAFSLCFSVSFSIPRCVVASLLLSLRSLFFCFVFSVLWVFAPSNHHLIALLSATCKNTQFDTQQDRQRQSMRWDEIEIFVVFCLVTAFVAVIIV